MKLGSGVLWLPVVLTVAMTGAMALGVNMLLRDALREHARVMRYELLAEGGDAIARAADLGMRQFERRLAGQMLRHPEHAAEILRAVDDGRGHAVAYDLRGNLLTADWTAPEIAALLDADQIDRRRAIQRLHGDTDFTEDNHARHLAGIDPVPVRAYYRIHEAAGVVVGIGQVQRIAAARVAHTDAQTRQYLRWYGMIGAAIGLGGVLIAGGLGAWATRRWVVLPLRRVEQAFAGGTPVGAGLTGRAARAGDGIATIQREVEAARAEAQAARLARLEAEEERDRLRADFNRELRAAVARAEAGALETLRIDRAALVARAGACLDGAHAPAFQHWRELAERADIARAPMDVDAWLEAQVAAWPGDVRARLRPNLSARASVAIDPASLAEAVRALVDNALAADPSGTVSLDTARDGDSVEIRIVDSGPGVAEAIRGVVFEPLFSTHAGSAGLGLAVVREVARLHGGSVEVRSESGKGAAFILRLPAAD